MYCPYRACFFLNNYVPQYPGYTRQVPPPPLQVKPKNVAYKKSYVIVDLRIPVFSGGPSQQVLNNINSNVQNDITEFAAQIEEGAKNDLLKQQQEGKNVKPYEASNVYEVTYNKNGILSMTLLYHILLGNLNNYVKTGYTYDIVTGRSLSLGDLFKPGINYIQILNNEVRKEIAANSKSYTTPAASFKGISEDHPFYLQDSNLVIFFGFNEVAPVSADIPLIRIPFSRISGILKPRLLR